VISWSDEKTDFTYGLIDYDRCSWERLDRKYTNVLIHINVG